MLHNQLSRPTPMALAFIEAAATPKASSKGRRSVEMACNREAGLLRERAVNTKLSFRTATKLKQEGVIA